MERWVRGKFVLAILFVNINIDNMTDIVFKEIRNNDLTQLKQKIKKTNMYTVHRSTRTLFMKSERNIVL